MRTLLIRAPLEALVLAALAAAVSLFTLGTSNVQELQAFALDTRWLMLLVFTGTALLLAVARPVSARPSTWAYALGAFLCALALVSAAWSPYPRLTLERGGTFVVALIGAGALGVHASGRPRFVVRCGGVLVGVATALAAAGFVMLAVDKERAIQGSTADSPVRLQGLGMNPNTASLLYAVVAPIAVWLAFDVRSRAWRAAAWLAVALIAVSLFASGSRGATVASFVGVVVVVLLRGGAPLRRATLVAATAGVYAVGVVSSNYRSLQPEFATAVKPRPAQTPVIVRPTAPGKTGVPSKGSDRGVELAPGVVLPTVGPVSTRWRRAFPHVLTNYPYDIYQIGFERPPGLLQPVQTGIFRGSGRLQVWDGALEEIRKRPFLGFGFGLEEQVFVDRYYAFEGSRPENSYLGWLLQLGAVGTLVFVALGGFLVLLGARRRGDAARAALAGAVVAGLLLAVIQSWVYSVGSLATVPFWVLAGLLAGYAGSVPPEPAAAPAPTRAAELREAVGAR